MLPRGQSVLQLARNFQRIVAAGILNKNNAPNKIAIERQSKQSLRQFGTVSHPIAPNKSPATVKEVTNGFEIVVTTNTNNESESKPLFVDHMWLRDHCQCDKCYNWQTFQRENGPQHIGESIQPINWSLESEGNLKVEWPCHHESSFTLKWLQENIFTDDDIQPKLSVKLWNRDLKKEDYPHVKYVEESDSDKFAQQVLSNLRVFGFCLIHEVVPDLEQLRIVCSKIGPILNGFWGNMWTVQSSTADSGKSDSAFSNVGLPPHTDGTYFTESPGLEVFCRFDTTAVGGETILVDGFQAANRLKFKHPEAYEFLSNTPIESYYADKSGHFFSHYDTVLRHIQSSNDLIQIRFNPLDVAPIKSIPQKNIRAHYRSYSLLSNEINDPGNKISLPLKSGSMIIVDNWRVLHGRKPFTGQRVLGGCYIARTDYYSKAKKLGLI